MIRRRRSTSTMRNSVRLFQSKDVGGFVDLLRRIGSHGHIRWPEHEEGVTEWLSTPRVEPELNLFVAEDQNKLNGYSFAYPELNIGRAVLGVGVDRNFSVAALRIHLIERAIERARELRAESADIAVGAEDMSSRGAIAFAEFLPVTRMLELISREPRLDAALRYPLPDAYSIRRGANNDAELLTSLQNSVFDGSWGYSPNSVDDIEVQLQQKGAGPERVFIAEDADGRAVAFNWTRIEEQSYSRTGYIQMTGVLPAHRGVGLGIATVAAGVTDLAQEGVASISLEVIESNVAAVRTYSRLDFETQGIVDWYKKALA